ncbi:MAG: hypothetical protein AAGA92_07450 [Planctomycetota bacterium]
MPTPRRMPAVGRQVRSVPRSQHRSKRLASVLAAIACCVACNGEDAITTYRVERVTAAPPRRESPEAFVQRLDHMLVAVFPRESDALFFKLTGKAPVVDEVRQQFGEFIASVDPAGPSWELPGGWSESKASGLRLATIGIPYDTGSFSGTLECTVTVLPKSGDWEDYLESNIVRWMRQLGLTSEFTPPPPRKTMLGFAQPIPGSGGSLIELRGVLQQAALPQQPPGQTAGRPATPSGEAREAPPSARADIQYSKPDSWQPGRMSPARKAAFRIPGDVSGSNGDGEVTVTVFPAAPGSPMADVEGNVARWRGQLGDAAQSVEPRVTSGTVSGNEAKIVELIGPAEQPDARSMRVAMVPVAGRVWFIKLAGTRSLVAAEEANFQAFLDSIQL